MNQFRKSTRVVIGEDSTIVRQGLRALLEASGEFSVVGEAEDGLEVIRVTDKHQPDLILLDLSMPKMNGIPAINEIRRKTQAIKILVLTIHADDEFIIDAFQAGANGYCLKDDSYEDLLKAMTTVMDGKTYLSPAISDKVLEGYLEGKKRLKKKTSWDTLTQREKEVLKLIGEGYKNMEIADFLCISEKTVSKHRSNIMSKLDIHNASGLTAYAIEKRLVSISTES
ncbi:MAG: response regulator [Thermodesulfobacteriota bacterium]